MIILTESEFKDLCDLYNKVLSPETAKIMIDLLKKRCKHE